MRGRYNDASELLTVLTKMFGIPRLMSDSCTRQLCTYYFDCVTRVGFCIVASRYATTIGDINFRFLKRIALAL
jgi:hypothetical protein